MNLDMLDRSTPNDPQVADCIRLLDAALAETRTISHLLHPPLLDETGLRSAATWYVEGFSKRSGIATTLDIPTELDRLPALVELAMFRILQEALTNIHKHSQSTQASVAVKMSPRDISLVVHDNGKGISPETLKHFRQDGVDVGVGLAGMRERIRELGGSLDLVSDRTGTILTAKLARTPGTANAPNTMR
jgi:two-component system NarL family sensor kinase